MEEDGSNPNLFLKLAVAFHAGISERDNQIKELYKKNMQCMSEISQLKSTHEVKEYNWTTDIEKLNMELDEKGLLVDDLNKKLGTLMLEKNEVNAQLDTLRAEKYSRDNLIQEIETRLNSLQANHVGVLLSFNNAQKAANELTHRVLELEKVVDNQKEVISFIGAEKKELEEKSESVDDLNKKLMLEKNEVIGQLETLRAEKGSQENLIQELEIHLNALQAEHVEVIASFDKAQKATNELTHRVLELEKVVDNQKEVISFIGEEKKELEEKSESVDDLNKKLMLEKNEVIDQLETLRAEKRTQENLNQELEIRLNALQAEHVDLLASFDNAKQVKNELTTKVVEFEKEVDTQKEVMENFAKHFLAKTGHVVLTSYTDQIRNIKLLLHKISSCSLARLHQVT